MRVRPYGDRAVLCELDDPADVPALRAAGAELDGVLDAVAGARTVLLISTSGAAAQVLAAAAGLRPSAVDPAASGQVSLDVTYDGPDLAAIAERCGLSVPEVVRRHSAPEYVVRFCGFAPGFAYLDGLDPALRVPRHDEPRTSVAPGSVGIAGEFTGVYPRASPGGWQLLGRTPVAVWDLDRDPPALLAPGTRVRFRPA